MNNALMILIYTDGTRDQFDLQHDGANGWLPRGVKRVGDEVAATADRIARLVLVVGTEITQYNASEAREVMDLD